MIIVRVEMGAVQKAISLYGVGTNRHDLLLSKNYFLDSSHLTILIPNKKRSFTNCLNLNFKTCFAVLLILTHERRKRRGRELI